MVQAMVFGNRSLRSGAGVAFSRDPSNGAPTPVIEMLFDAQGEDVVSGRRTPESEAEIRAIFPDLADELVQVLSRIEREFKDVQDVEFTIEDGQLWVLQTRSAKRTPRATLKFALDFVHEGLIGPKEALGRLEGLDPKTLVRTHFVDPGEPAAVGIAASSGVAIGRAAFRVDSLERLAALGIR